MVTLSPSRGQGALELRTLSVHVTGAAVAGRPPGHMTPGWSQTGVPAGAEEGECTVQSLFSETPPSSGGSRQQRTALLGCGGRPGAPWSLRGEAHRPLPSWDDDRYHVLQETQVCF